jgi:prepilin-type N-terminal cleavage/methylation domain-containing protein
MSLFSSQNQGGFSLVEMLVSVSILLLVIVGPMTVTSRTAKSSAFATEQVQAFFLAQEGLELAQLARDELLLRNFEGAINNPWARFTDSSGAGTYNNCYGASGCGLEWNTTTALASPISCSPVTNCKLNYKPSAARSWFTHSTVGDIEATPFTRRVYFTVSGGNSVQVRSVVTWQTGSILAEQKVEAQTYLYNIYATQ